MSKQFEIVGSRFYNSVKSKLNNAGLKGFVKKDYEDAAQAINLVSVANPSQEEINAAVEWLKRKHNSKIMVPEEPLTTTPTALQTINSEDSSLPQEAFSSQEDIKETGYLTIAEAIAGAPDILRNELLMDYAERRFEEAQDFLNFKLQIDQKIEQFITNNITKGNQQQLGALTAAKAQLGQSWEAKRQRQQKTFQDYLGNIEARMAEFD